MHHNHCSIETAFLDKEAGHVYWLAEASSTPRIAIFPVVTSTGPTRKMTPIVTATFCTPFAVKVITLNGPADNRPRPRELSQTRYPRPYASSSAPFTPYTPEQAARVHDWPARFTRQAANPAYCRPPRQLSFGAIKAPLSA